MVVIVIVINEDEKLGGLKITFLQGNLPRVAIATVTAGLRCPPETPPLTSTPSITPKPHLQRFVSSFGVLTFQIYHDCDDGYITPN